MSILHERVLVLNKNWMPVGTVTVEEAIVKVYGSYDDGIPKARIIDPETFSPLSWEEWSNITPKEGDRVISSACDSFKVPEIIILSRFEKLPKPKGSFSRRTLFKRDQMQCQYCSIKLGMHESTIDHVVPKSHGGKTTWENCVLACIECNRKKADKTPDQAKMALKKEPKKPDIVFFRFDSAKPIKSWEFFIGKLYWHPETEVQNA